jgi:hypothetical protein
VFFVAVFGIAAYGIYYTTNLGKTPYIRRLAPLEAIDEGIGRAVEEGKKVHFGVWMANPGNPGALANLSIMGYFAEKVAAAGIPAFYTTSGPGHGFEVIKSIVRERYIKAGKLDYLNNPDVVQTRMFPGTIEVYLLALTQLLQRERIGFSMMGGGDMGGAIQKVMIIGGEAHRAANTFSILSHPGIRFIEFGIPCYDYILMMQETYVAGAMLNKDPTQLSHVVGVDLLTWTMLALLVIFTVVATALNLDLSTILVG